jgi:hypothetical protein
VWRVLWYLRYRSPALASGGYHTRREVYVVRLPAGAEPQIVTRLGCGARRARDRAVSAVGDDEAPQVVGQAQVGLTSCVLVSRVLTK